MPAEVEVIATKVLAQLGPEPYTLSHMALNPKAPHPEALDTKSQQSHPWA